MPRAGKSGDEVVDREIDRCLFPAAVHPHQQTLGSEDAIYFGRKQKRVDEDNRARGCVAKRKDGAIGLNAMGRLAWRESQHLKREVEGQDPGESIGEQSGISTDAAAYLDCEITGRTDFGGSASERVFHNRRPLWRDPGVPLACEIVEVAFNVMPELVGPALGIDSGRSPGRDSHRV